MRWRWMILIVGLLVTGAFVRADAVSKGNAAFQEAEFKTALMYYQQAAEKEASFTTYANLGHCYLHLKQYSSAQTAYQSAYALADKIEKQQLRPDYARALYLNHNYSGALPLYHQLASENDDNIEYYLLAARSLNALFFPQAAKNILYDCLQIGHVDNGGVLELLFHCTSQSGQFEEAIVYADKLIDLNPANHGYYMASAQTQMLLNRTDQAIITLRLGTKLADEPLSLYRRLGQLYVDREMFYEAADCFSICAGIDPNFSSQDYYQMGWAFYQVNEMHRAQKALAAIQAEAPVYGKAQMMLGKMAEVAGDSEKAAEYYQRASEAVKDWPDPLVLLANWHLQRKQYAEAATAFQKAIDRGCQDSAVYLNCVNLYIICQEKEKAIDCLKQAMARWPQDEGVHELIQQFPPEMN